VAAEMIIECVLKYHLMIYAALLPFHAQNGATQVRRTQLAHQESCRISDKVCSWKVIYLSQTPYGKWKNCPTQDEPELGV
jgi:hypothetical protein